MPKGEYLFDASNPKLENFYEDVYSNLPANILQEFVATLATQHSIFELQALCERHTGMGEVIKAYAMRPLIQKDFGEKALTIYDKLIQQDNHKDLSLSKFYQICIKLKEEVEQLRGFINSKEMKFFTALTDWPAQSAAELNDLNNFFDKTINRHYQVLIAYLARPGLQDLDGRTPLIWASLKGHFATVKALLAEPGIDVNKACNDGDTPLIWAACRGHLDTIKVLLAQPGIDVNKAGNDGDTPLFWAACNGYSATVKALLAQPGIDVNKANNVVGDTPLIWAAHNGHLETVKALLAQPGIDVNKASINGYTPLNRAAYNGQIEIVKALLAQPGIDVLKVDNYGNTPLYWVELCGYEEIWLLFKNHIPITGNSATAAPATPGYAALHNQGAANNDAVSTSNSNNFSMT